MLLGRAEEQAAIDSLLDGARAGHGGGLAIHGEPGIGKSALLAYAADQAAGIRVLRTVGVEPESDIAYAALHRLVLPVLDRVQRLPEPQARALAVVFGQATGDAPERFLVGLATLSLLSEAAGDGALACLVDDAHLADAPSLHALSFVARRLDAEPIAVILAARAGEGRSIDAAALTDLPLAGLDRESARALLAQHGGARLPTIDQERLLEATAGNPLAIRELPAVVPWDGPLPIANGLRRAFVQRVRHHGEAAQRLLLLIAADGSGRPETIHRAAATLGLSADLLGTGELDDLVAIDGGRVAVRHPLIRSAVYHAAGATERRAAHRALAAALEADPADLDRRAWHLGRAAEKPDETVAADLERSAVRSLGRAGPGAAAAAFGHAADLSTSDELRARRLVAAATASFHSGDTPGATAFLDQVDGWGRQPETVRIDAVGLRALMELRSGTPADALELLRSVIPDAARADGHRLVRLLMLFGEAGFQANAAEAWSEIGELLETLPLTGDGPENLLARLFRGARRAQAGADTRLASTDLAAAEQLADPVELCSAGGMMWGLGHYERGRRMRHAAVLRARQLGAVGTLAWALQFLVTEEFTRARFGVAEAYAEEGLRFAVETGQPNTACHHRASLARIAAVRGREREATELAGSVLEEASERRLSGALGNGYLALATLYLAGGRPGEALERLQAFHSGTDATHPGLVYSAMPELVEAAVRANRPEQVPAAFARFTGWASATGAPEARALAARCHALLADGAAAEQQFQVALEHHSRTDRPIDQARTRLLFGQHLRRHRRKAEARRHLRAALETFERIGASAWAARAREELRATGETVGRREPSAMTRLTPQEVRIVTAVSEGVTNKEVAARLFVSPRTVDYHLRKVFQKLGISSRSELIRLAIDAADPRGEPSPE